MSTNLPLRIVAPILACAFATCGLLFAGCTGRTAEPSSASPTVIPSPSVSSPPVKTVVARLPYDASRDPVADIAAAQAAALQDHKHVLLDFGANWCPDCLVLDRIYQSETVEPLLSSGYHVVTIDVGEFDRNLDISDAYGGVIEAGIPALVILDDHGNVLVTTASGEFADARTMTPAEVFAFLKKWAPGSDGS